MPKLGVFDAYSEYYNLLYADKPYEREVAYIRDVLGRFGLKNGNLLEFGCGTGRHGRLLGNCGFSVMGVEQSSSMLAMSENTDSFCAVRGNLLEIDFKRSFDGVLALFHVFSYQVSDTDSNRFFRQANLHTKTGGLLLLDFWYTPAVLSIGCSVRVKEINNGSIHVLRLAEPLSFPNENRIDVKYTIFTTSVETGKISRLTEIHSMRHYSLPEISYIANVNGFEIINSEEFLTGCELGKQTWGACVTFRKVKSL